MTRRSHTLDFSCLVLAGILFAMPAAAEIYRWTDAEGDVHFTGQLDKVPPAHRAAAREKAASKGAERVHTYSGNAGDGEAAPRRISSPAHVANGEIEIPFVRVGSLMRVDALVNDIVSVPFLIDTGASGVSLPSIYAERLGVRIRGDTPQVDVSTANGVVARPLIELRSINLAGARVEDLTATVNPAMEIGLLGGDFFNNYIYRVDAAKRVMTLTLNSKIRGGLGPEEWRRRFRMYFDPLERLEAYLREHPELRASERSRLDERRTELQTDLAELERDADKLGVPQLWRR